MFPSDDREPLPSPHPRATVFQTASVNCLGTLEAPVLRSGLFADMYLITRDVFHDKAIAVGSQTHF